MNKQDFLKQYQTKEWYETSKRIKARDHNTCQMCGRNDLPLSVHHRYYGKNGSLNVPDDALVTLCERCHKLETDAKAEIYDDVNQLIEMFNEKGLSLNLLESLIGGIINTINLAECGELKEFSVQENYFMSQVYGTQIISDIFALKKMGIECRDLVEQFYPQFLEKYNNIQ